jgi:hypothetical protein
MIKMSMPAMMATRGVIWAAVMTMVFPLGFGMIGWG